MMHFAIASHPFSCKFAVVCSLLSMRSHKKNFILNGSGRVHIVSRIGCGISGLLRKVYMELIVNCWFGEFP
jgi:hypothetical protein